MAIDFNKPVDTDTYQTLLAALREHHQGQAKLWEGVTLAAGNNIPTGAVRISGGLFQRWDGSAWVAKAMGYVRADGTFAEAVAAYDLSALSKSGTGRNIPMVVSSNGESNEVGVEFDGGFGFRVLGFDSAGRLRVGGSTTVASNDVVWTSGNDGAASGLDADLLDGQQGSYYRDLGNATGTLAAARIGTSTAYAFGNACTVRGYPLGPIGFPIDDFDANTTVNSSFNGAGLRHASATAHTYTIATEASGGWEPGACFMVYVRNNSGAVTVQGASGVTLRVGGSAASGSRTLTENQVAIFRRLLPDLWLMTMQ